MGKKIYILAPDPITGFNMTLLRMLAFYPSTQYTNNSIGAKTPKKKIDRTKRNKCLGQGKEKTSKAV